MTPSPRRGADGPPVESPRAAQPAPRPVPPGQGRALPGPRLVRVRARVRQPRPLPVGPRGAAGRRRVPPPGEPGDAADPVAGGPVAPRVVRRPAGAAAEARVREPGRDVRGTGGRTKWEGRTRPVSRAGGGPRGRGRGRPAPAAPSEEEAAKVEGRPADPPRANPQPPEDPPHGHDAQPDRGRREGHPQAVAAAGRDRRGRAGEGRRRRAEAGRRRRREGLRRDRSPRSSRRLRTRRRRPRPQSASTRTRR